MKNKNLNCDGNHCFKADGEVRLLPVAGGGNVKLCRTCYHHEISWRLLRNRSLSPDCRFPLPFWKELNIA